MDSTSYSVVAQTPSANEYISLRAAAGLSPKTMEAADRGLPNSLYSVCVRHDGELVGMGRVIGDGGCNFEIVDVAVHPNHQRQGLGTRIMESLVAYLRENAPSSAYICLIADEGAPALYRRFGFEFTAPASVGMALKL